jgi:hypothetical protein
MGLPKKATKTYEVSSYSTQPAGWSLPFNLPQCRDSDNNTRDSDCRERKIGNERQVVEPSSTGSLSNVHNAWLLCIARGLTLPWDSNDRRLVARFQAAWSAVGAAR